MIKEAISTFNEGVNFDLNPITTPQNVLTDCVNGTFITFNGDELALQNDAGNTTIDYLGNPVRLSPGFYPIGIKEYGGVLYIVSAKEPTITATLFNDANSYDQGEVVYKEISDIRHYFESLIDDNLETLPLQSNQYWLYVGLEKDFINKYGFVEFGSYPSPEVVDASLNDESLNYILENWPYTSEESFKLNLYSPRVINNSLFRAGVYVNFHAITGGALDTTNISFSAFDVLAGKFIKNDATSEKKIYKVKLYHQLTNGIIDLTDDVWKKFASHVLTTYAEELNTSGSPRFWFNDTTFKYYCPHNFKGKLMLSVELEEFDQFSLVNTNIIYDTVNYTTTFNVDSAQSAGWDNASFADICYTLNGDEPNFDTLTTTNIIVSHRTLPSFTLVKPAADSGKTLKYKMRPQFYLGGSPLPYTDFPQQFLDIHTISGTLLITSESEDYIISIDSTSYISDPLSDGRFATRLTLFNDIGEYLKNDLSVSVTPYQFYLESTTPPTNPLGTYTIGPDRRAVMTTWDLTNVITPAYYQNYIESLVENTIVYELYEDFGEVILTVEVNRTFGTSYRPITVLQGGSVKIPFEGSYGPVFKYRLNAGVLFTISALPGLDFGLNTNPAYNYNGSIFEDTTINFGLITSLTLNRWDDVDEFYDSEFYLYTSVSNIYFGPNISSSRYTIIQTNIDLSPTTFPVSIKAGESDRMFLLDPSSTETPVFDITFNNLATNIYDNLTGLDLALEGDNHLFLKEYIGLI